MSRGSAEMEGESGGGEGKYLPGVGQAQGKYKPPRGAGSTRVDGGYLLVLQVAAQKVPETWWH